MNVKILAIIAVLLVATAGVVGVFVLTQNDDSEGFTLTDARGREVTIPDNVDSILAIKSCSLELVSFFNAVNKVMYVDVNEKFEGSDNRTHGYILKDKLSGLDRLDPSKPENVIASGVDLIISSSVTVTELDKEQSDCGIPVFGINADLEFGDQFYEQIIMLGKLFKEEERAEELVNGIKKMISDITYSFLPTDSGEVSYELFSAYVCGMNFMGVGNLKKTTGDYLPFEYAHIRNVMDSDSTGVGKQPYSISTVEVIKDRNPQYIFVDGGNYNVTLSDLRESTNKRTLKDVDAIVNNKVYATMVYKSWGTNWQNQLINVYFVADTVHGDRFDWVFEEKADEILQLFHPGTDVTYAELASVQTGGGCRQITV
jgi:ABC-type Fe3+-hydroxamate transport system, periplasmic component